MRVKGKVITGMGWAHITVPLQMLELKKLIPSLEKCFPATLNLQLERKLEIVNPTLETHSIKWDSTGLHKKLPPEKFRLTSVKLLAGGKWIAAWIYQAEFSHNRLRHDVVEVIAERVFSNSGATFVIDINSDRITRTWWEKALGR